jgi:hypothetical protein
MNSDALSVKTSAQLRTLSMLADRGSIGLRLWSRHAGASELLQAGEEFCNILLSDSHSKEPIRVINRLSEQVADLISRTDQPQTPLHDESFLAQLAELRDLIRQVRSTGEPIDPELVPKYQVLLHKASLPFYHAEKEEMRQAMVARGGYVTQ